MKLLIHASLFTAATVEVDTDTGIGRLQAPEAFTKKCSVFVCEPRDIDGAYEPLDPGAKHRAVLAALALLNLEMSKDITANVVGEEAEAAVNVNVKGQA